MKKDATLRLRLNEQMADDLAKIADQQDRPVSQIVRELIRDYLKTEAEKKEKAA